MAEKRIIVDHHHAMRQHKAFAFMVIALLLVVLAVWFVQVKLMVRTVDFNKLQQSVLDAQATFSQSVDDAGVDNVTTDASVAAAAIGDAIADATAAADAEDAVRAGVAAQAAAALTTTDDEPHPAEPDAALPETTITQ